MDKGALGRITGARFRRSHGGVSGRRLPDYWFDTSLTGGGAMMDLGAHPVYILSFLFGAPKRIGGLRRLQVLAPPCAVKAWAVKMRAE